MIFADICVNISHEDLDRAFTYIVPEEMEGLLGPGSKVKIPFGKRQLEGYVLGLKNYSSYPKEKLKEISEIVLTQEDSGEKLIKVAVFLSQRYGSTLIQALKTVLPIKKSYRRKKMKLSVTDSTVNFKPNCIQKSIIDDFNKEYSEGIRREYLIHGITGSGKTEIYIEMVKKAVALGKQCIVLIPEVSLTYQTVLRFEKYFGDRVGIMNYTLSQGSRHDYFEKAKKREIDVIIGPRSALFTPFPDTGLIIIDEEHESSYKSENMPKYHAREVAEYMMGLYGCSLVLGSATPSVESYYRALKGEIKLYKLDKRATELPLPQVYVEDMCQELRKGNKSIFSERLLELCGDRLSKGQQIMLFLNRRGYSGFISCRSCGNVIMCPHCDVSLSEHRDRGALVCHYCGFETPKPGVCPKCGSKYIAGFKAGTQQVQEEIKKIFPKARTIRMDGDTTTRKDSYSNILTTFKRLEADILIGTQMIVKGHDFPNVTLVGIIAADLSLGVNDFRAGERTFQLLTQAAGRAGRGSIPGEVVIQTYQCSNYCIRYAASQDYEGFFREEIGYRRLCGYPPIGNVCTIMFLGDNERNTVLLAQEIKNRIGQVIDKEISVFGPGKAGIGRLKDKYRFVLFLKSTSLLKLMDLRAIVEKYLENRMSDIEVIFDINPINSN